MPAWFGSKLNTSCCGFVEYLMDGNGRVNGFRSIFIKLIQDLISSILQSGLESIKESSYS